MKKLIMMMMCMVAMVACTSRKAAVADEAVTKVAFTVAQHYFFNNGQELPASPKITDEDEFNKMFGKAAVMGKNGMPTEIDFSKSFVLAVVMPITDVETELTPQKVEEKGDTLLYTYKVKTGDKLSYSMQPVSIIVLDRNYSEKEIILVKSEKCF